jgi:hypothetical protein
VTPVDRQPVNRQDEWWEKPGRVEDLRLRFKPDGLLRLARSTPEYYESHGHYLPGLAVLAYLDGQRVRDLEAALREARPFVASRSYWDDRNMEVLGRIDAALAPAEKEGGNP